MPDSFDVFFTYSMVRRFVCVCVCVCVCVELPSTHTHTHPHLLDTWKHGRQFFVVNCAPFSLAAGARGRMGNCGPGESTKTKKKNPRIDGALFITGAHDRGFNWSSSLRLPPITSSGGQTLCWRPLLLRKCSEAEMIVATKKDCLPERTKGCTLGVRWSNRDCLI